LTTISSNWDRSFKRPVKVRRTCKLAASDLQVLCADRGDDVAGRHAEIGNLVGVKPQPHRIIARAEDLDVANAVEPQQLVADLEQRVVGDVELIEAVVRRQHEHDHQYVG
jgi:hypothetical protein